MGELVTIARRLRLSIPLLLLLCVTFLLEATSLADAQDYFGATGTKVLQSTGCNATAYAQLPDQRDLFIGRQFFKTDHTPITVEEGCAGDSASREAVSNGRWGLVLVRLNWQTNTFQLLHPVLATPAVILAGPMKGAIIRAAYDPDIIKFRDRYLVSFECSIQNKEAYGVEGISSCIGIYDPKSQLIDLAHTNVVVSGNYVGPSKQLFHSASVPHLLAFQDRLIMYWSDITVIGGKFQHIVIRGAELAPDASGYYWIKEGARPSLSTNPPSVVVWDVDNSDPLSNTSVDVRAFWMHGSEIVGMAGIGGSGCTAPSSPQLGCFRLGMATASMPLAKDIFDLGRNKDVQLLPTNPQGYVHPIQTQDGNYAFLGAFYKPTNSYAKRQPVPPNWDRISAPGTLALVPFTDRSFWPSP